jgi:hypothetical protein
MADFGIELVNDQRVNLRFDRFPEAVHDRLLATLKSLEARLEAAVLAAEPSATGRMRSLSGGRVYDHGNRIAAVVGVRTDNESDARKAAALEYGSHRALQVRAHEAKLAHFWNRAVNPIMVEVRAHSRTPNIQQQRFLRDPIQAMRADAIAEMRAALDGAVGDAS